MKRTGIVLCLFFLACSSNALTTGSGDSALVCQSYCARLNGCDMTYDAMTCESTCNNRNAAVLPKLRSGVGSSVSQCVQKKDCRTVLDTDVLGKCVSETAASLAPSSAGTEMCDALDTSLGKCGKRLDKTGCLDLVKVFSDQAIGQAKLCAQKSCSDILPCANASLGSIVSNNASTTTTMDPNDPNDPPPPPPPPGGPGM